MKRGDELGHRRHRNTPRYDRANKATCSNATRDQIPCELELGRCDRQRRGHRDRHADHAEEVAAPRRGGARKPSER